MAQAEVTARAFTQLSVTFRMAEELNAQLKRCADISVSHWELQQQRNHQIKCIRLIYCMMVNSEKASYVWEHKIKNYP